MLKLGIMEKSTNPWSSPILLIKKSDGTNRLVFHDRNLNSVTEVEVFSMPRSDKILTSFDGSKYFIVLDNLKGFRQILI